MTTQGKGAQDSTAQQSAVDREMAEVPHLPGQARSDGVPPPSDEERDLVAMLRIVGWRIDDDNDVSEAEADLIFRAAANESVLDEERARVRAGVLRRLVDSGSLIAADDSLVQRPSLIRQCGDLGRDLTSLARTLRLDPATLLDLDRGGARSVPARLVQAAAESLALSVKEVARALAPAQEDVLPMAAHGQRRSRPKTLPAIRDFLDLINGSELPETEKGYWREVVRAESSMYDDPDGG